MREQIITPRAGAGGSGVPSSGRSAAGKGRAASVGVTQNPARRERAGKAAARRDSGNSSSAVLSYAPLAGKILLAVVAGVLLFTGYRAAASASFFQLRAINVGGATRVSEDDIRTIVRRNASRTGVWRADLNQLSAEIEKLPGVRNAVVSRVLPDGVRVRVTERTPRAIARTTNGRLVWVDDDAVTLGAASPADQLPAFFIVGLDEGSGEAARAANRERVQTYLGMSHEWDALRLSERVSEVNLTDVRDVRAQLAGDDAEIEVRLGARDFGKRLQIALRVLDEQRHTPRGSLITHLDATLERRVIVGFSSGAPQTSGESVDDNSSDNINISRAEKSPSPAPLKKQSSPQKETKQKEAKKETAPRKAHEPSRKKDHTEKRAATDAAKAKTRPRRVG
ncbi:MAG: cell division protein FtsQ/DivIB [Pyrinomonadaceae bacterium]